MIYYITAVNVGMGVAALAQNHTVLKRGWSNVESLSTVISAKKLFAVICRPHWKFVANVKDIPQSQLKWTIRILLFSMPSEESSSQFLYLVTKLMRPCKSFNDISLNIFGRSQQQPECHKSQQVSHVCFPTWLLTWTTKPLLIAYLVYLFHYFYWFYF